MFRLYCMGGPDKQPSVPAKQAKQKVVQIITITKVRSIWGLPQAVLDQIMALVQAVVNALLGQPAVTLNAVMTLTDVLLEVSVEIKGIEKNFTISLMDALEAYQSALAKGVSPVDALLGTITDVAAKEGIPIGPETMASIMGQRGANMLNRAAAPQGTTGQTQQGLEDMFSGLSSPAATVDFAQVSTPVPTQVAGPTQVKTQAINVGLRSLARNKIPWHATMAIGAAVLSMRGQAKPVDLFPVSLSPEAAKDLQDPDFRYEGYALSGLAITEFQASTAQPGAVEISALLTFSDAIGRRVSTMLAVRYGFSGRNVKILKASVLPVAPSKPLAKIFIVPAKDVPSNFLQLDEREMLTHVAAKAVRRSGNIQKTKKDYYVFAYYLDRLPADAEVQLRVSEAKDGIRGDPGNSVGLYYQGRRVAVQRATFALNGKHELFFKALYQPASEGRPSPQLAEVVSTHI
ncbi:MAG TPA: hypothetical protein QGH84_01745 [Rhodospirillales bacterium]|nr:hypothetical protein [Rhodospirillales bacterium]